jgi:hypothetical protein
MILDPVHLDHDRQAAAAPDWRKQEVHPFAGQTTEPGIDLHLRFDRPKAGRAQPTCAQHKATSTAWQDLWRERIVPVEDTEGAKEPLLKNALDQCPTDRLVNPGFGPGKAIPFLKDRLHHLPSPIPVRLPWSEL